MRTTEASARPRAVGRRGRRTTSVVASAACLCAGGVLLGAPAVAEPRQPEVPSQAAVEQAQERAEEATDRVAAIQGELAAANARLEAAAVQAAQAFEAYNGARWAAEQATEEVRRATADAARAERQLARQRDRLAGMITATYQDAGQLGALDAVLGADGPRGVMGELLAHEGASVSMDAELQRFEAAAGLADAFRAQAEESRAEKVLLLAGAEAAKEAAAAAASSAQSVAESVAARKSALVAELARLQGISVGLAEQRQSALEELERQRAAEEAARLAAQQAELEVATPVEPADDPVATEPQTEAQPEPQPEPRSAPQPDPQPAPRPQPEPQPATVAPPPVDATPPAPTGGAASAIAFARAQLGDPYVWGAAGPDSWDCSGLTMMAWAAAGVSLPHYSVAQYDATTPISAADLRPGDLVFWGSTSSPGSIFHVALYAGDGMIIHAPRTGRPVTLDSMYYWVPPNFFGRV